MNNLTKERDQNLLINCLVIDDHPMFGDAMSMALVDIFPTAEVVVAGNLNDGLKTLRNMETVDYIILDLNLPDVDGLEGLARILNLETSGHVIVVSSVSDNNIIAAAIEQGASGFVPKDSPREDLTHAFHIIKEGAIYTPANYLPPQINSQSITHQDATRKIASLTPQQATILRLISDGKLNKQIAYELSIAESTVKAHLTAIMRKLDVQNRTQAALLANQSSLDALVEPNDEER